MDVRQAHAAHVTRRQFFRSNAGGIGALALAGLIDPAALSSETATGPVGLPGRVAGIPGLPHFAAKAKRVIYLFQNGAPPHLDMFDNKPALENSAARRFRPAFTKTSASRR